MDLRIDNRAPLEPGRGGLEPCDARARPAPAATAVVRTSRRDNMWVPPSPAFGPMPRHAAAIVGPFTSGLQRRASTDRARLRHACSNCSPDERTLWRNIRNRLCRMRACGCADRARSATVARMSDLLVATSGTALPACRCAHAGYRPRERELVALSNALPLKNPACPLSAGARSCRRSRLPNSRARHFRRKRVHPNRDWGRGRR